MAKLKVVHKWVGLGRVQSFMLILGRVGLNHLGRVGSRKLDPRPIPRRSIATITDDQK